MFTILKMNIKHKIIQICTYILEKLIGNDKILVFLSEEEYKEYCEFKDNIFIVYGNEQELKNDWPDAKQIIKK